MRGRVITVSLPEFSKTLKNREEYFIVNERGNIIYKLSIFLKMKQ